MNHRQWKKQFKKTHGRNPYVHEDKKKMPRWTVDIVKEAVQDLVKAAKEAGEVLVEYFKAIAKSTEEAMEDIDSTPHMM